MPVSSQKKTTNATRQAIIEGASLEFAEFGFDGTSARKIGKRAGVDYTLITYYFGTKEALWKEVVLAGYSAFQSYRHQIIQQCPELTAGQYIRKTMEIALRYSSQNPLNFRMLTQEMLIGSSRFDWVREELLADHSRLMLGKIREAQDSGEIAEGDPGMFFQLMAIGIRLLILSKRSAAGPVSLQTVEGADVEKFWDLFDRIFFSNVESPA